MTLRLTTSQWWKLIGVFVLMFLIFNASRNAIGRLEGHINPVVSDVTIDVIVEGDNFIDFSGAYKKLRDCDTISYEWFLMSRDGAHADRFDVFIYNPNWRNVPTGPARYGPRRAYILAEELLGHTYSVATHRCHPFYNTRSTFFKGSEIK